jgi:Domain of unknown function (DUF4105)
MSGRRTALILIFLAAAFHIQAQSAEEDYTVSLVTTGPGEEVYLWWGHTAFLVENRQSGRADFYDFGVFSFETENFFLNFLFGRLWYMAYRSPAQRSLERTKQQDRTIRIQELRFPAGKKIELIRELEYRVRPENREYLYDYYRDNCATRIRDILDQAYGGELYRVSSGDAALTIRLQTRRFTGRNPLVEWVLMFLMSGEIDRPASGWEAMFLPSEIPRYLENLRIESGPAAELPAVVSDYVYHQGKLPAAVPDSPGKGLLWPAAAGILLGLVLAFGRRRTGTPGAIVQLLYRVLLLVAALLGTVLFFFMFFTDHEVTHGNWNILLLNPLHWLSLFGAYRLKDDERIFRRFAVYFPWILTIDVSLLLILGSLFDIPRQETAQITAFLLPLALGIAGPWIWRVLKPSGERSIVT